MMKAMLLLICTCSFCGIASIPYYKFYRPPRIHIYTEQELDNREKSRENDRVWQQLHERRALFGIFISFMNPANKNSRKYKW